MVKREKYGQKGLLLFPALKELWSVFQGLIQHYRRKPELRCLFHLQLQPQHHHRHHHPHPNSTELAQGEPEMNAIGLVRAGPRVHLGFLLMRQNILCRLKESSL